MAATTPPRTLACLLAPPNPDSVRLSRPGVDPLGRRATSPPSIFPSFQLLTNSLTKVARRLVGIHERSGLSLSCVRARAGVRSPHMMVQGIGMQQHSKSPQSMHGVLSPAGLTMLSARDEAAEPGPPARLTGEEPLLHARAIVLAGR
ncbi:hypothetical protein Purlil1_10054 [Purpureocillium lilacinum]|uniref:Uncharacterized protein n=1 Tax=Purpureocillium lilacinum TaxID=33203 RepID=A0ABR0BNV6_PURLI|nr:hypothetical protein Purlil1_10054 [Purpureocillium lilacinum]